MQKIYEKHPSFKEFKTIEKELAVRLNKIYILIENEIDHNRKVSLLNEMARVLNQYDDQIKSINGNFPDFYTENKVKIDKLILENNNFLNSILEEINFLQNKKPN